jgi:hypothetical protein
VDACVRALFERYDVVRLYADPPYWESAVAQWAGDFPDRVFEWFTNRPKAMSAALAAFSTALRDGSLSHDGSDDYARHVANARRRDLRERDDQGRPLWVVQKDRPDSIFKIDAAMAGVLSWEARTDALAAGQVTGESVWESDQYELLII